MRIADVFARVNSKRLNLTSLTQQHTTVGELEWTYVKDST